MASTDVTLDQLAEAERLIERGRAHLKIENYDAAETMFKQGSDVLQKAVGNDDARVADLLDELGVVRTHLNKTSEAHDCFNAALLIFEKLYYDGHYKVGLVHLHQTDCFLKEGKKEAAEESCTKANDILGKTVSGEHRLALEAAYKLAAIQRDLGKNADALKVIAKVKKGVETPLGPFEEFRFLEAMIMEDEGKPEEAGKAYLDAINGFKQRRGFKRLADCLERYAKFLANNGRNDDSQTVARAAVQYRKLATSRSEDIFPATLLRA